MTELPIELVLACHRAVEHARWCWSIGMRDDAEIARVVGWGDRTDLVRAAVR